ncbi:hypothetical protein QBC35DRAFT_451607 [Podospora australis]|uniref:Ankyrin repeat protein n=1 Tax=Podospora australis TaxID=1536484 RepID=A0AAN7AGV8_9PEZI|nr:hypothetical protein QBC35DRAFT_451607 [Podospora australis]
MAHEPNPTKKQCLREPKKISIDPEGDLILRVGEDFETAKDKCFTEFRVCSRAVRRASPVWKSKLSESPMPTDGSEWVIPFPDDDPVAMHNILAICHGHFRLRTTENFVTCIAINHHADKYDALHLVRDYAEPWAMCDTWELEEGVGIVDNSFAAIANGVNQGFFLHEVDAIVWERLDRAFVAHDMHPKRIANLEETWDAYSFHEIVKTGHVTRGVKMGSAAKKKTPDANAGIGRVEDSEGAPTHTDFASTYLNTDGKIPGLLEILWNETRKPFGRTLQIDFRNEDFAKAFPYYSYHISKVQFPASDGSRGAQHTLAWKMLESTILKGYNWKFGSFDALHQEIKRESVKTYGRNCFELQHLHMFPPLIMIFQPEPIIALAKKTEPANPRWGRKSYEHIHDLCMKQIESFVGIETGEPGMSYNFILEICHSGLGLRYDKTKNIARNPFNDELLVDDKVIFESLVDRAMIDVSLKLRKQHPDLLFSSCTRLPDVTTTERAYKTSFQTAELRRFKDGEAGLSSNLRALHGGLYPRSHLVIADDPMAEIVVCTWIDEEGKLDRERLLQMPYYQWLATCSRREVRYAIVSINKSDFRPNKFLQDYPLESPHEKVRNWREGLNSSTGDNSHGQNGEPAVIAISDGAFTLGTLSEAQHAANSLGAYKAASRGDEARLRKLISKGVHLNDFTGRYGTPLAVASARGHSTIVRLLLNAKADITLGQSWGSPFEIATFYGSPLELASYYGHGHIVDMVLAKLGEQVDLTHQATKKQCIGAALHQASEKGHAAVVQRLLDMGADVESLGDRYEATVLQVASSCGNIDIIKTLLKRKANVNAHGMRHCTALRAACRYGHVDAAKLLLCNGAVVDFPLETWFKPEIRTLLKKAGEGTSRSGPCTGSAATGPDIVPEQCIVGELRFDNLDWMAKHGYNIRPLVDRMKSNGWPKRNPQCHLTNLRHSPDHRKIVASQESVLNAWEEKMRRQREQDTLNQVKKLTDERRVWVLQGLVKFFLQKQELVKIQLESCGCLLCIFDKQAHESLEGMVQSYNTKPIDPVAFTMKQIRDRRLAEYKAKIKSEID